MSIARSGLIGTALTAKQNQKDGSRQQCSGMYSRKSWGGSVNPFILTKFIKVTPADDSDPIVSLIVFEWKDEYLFGQYASPDALEVWSNTCILGADEGSGLLLIYSSL